MIVTGRLYSLGTVLLILLATMVDRAYAEEPDLNCIKRPSQNVRLSRVPAKITDLKPQVSIPVEGYIKLHFNNSDTSSMWLSPTGDFTFAAGPYDPNTKRLYIWGYFNSGWIEVQHEAGTWLFGQSGTIRPKLYYPADDIEDVEIIERSEVLGVQFYSGFTAPHWLTGSQTYRVYQMSGADMSRVGELDIRNLRYLGDDQVKRFAVFAPNGSHWTQDPAVLVWYDGVRIIEPAPGAAIPNRWCS